jgi:hypothetical protein
LEHYLEIEKYSWELQRAAYMLGAELRLREISQLELSSFVVSTCMKCESTRESLRTLAAEIHFDEVVEEYVRRRQKIQRQYLNDWAIPKNERG